jgi:hypothetical protein
VVVGEDDGEDDDDGGGAAAAAAAAATGCDTSVGGVQGGAGITNGIGPVLGSE